LVYPTPPNTLPQSWLPEIKAVRICGSWSVSEYAVWAKHRTEEGDIENPRAFFLTRSVVRQGMIESTKGEYSTGAVAAFGDLDRASAEAFRATGLDHAKLEELKDAAGRLDNPDADAESKLDRFDAVLNPAIVKHDRSYSDPRIEAELADLVPDVRPKPSEVQFFARKLAAGVKYRTGAFEYGGLMGAAIHIADTYYRSALAA